MSQSEKKEPRKQFFLQGAAILAIGVLLSKVIGALFKIPLTRMITTEGAGHFNVAYNIYIVLLNVSSTGLPIAVSRLISEAAALGQRRQVQRIHQISLRLFWCIGLISGGAMYLFAPQVAGWMRDPDAQYAIATLAPAVLFVCIGSAFRGYFQGQQYMTPTAVAQVLEAACKLLIGLLAAQLILNAGLGYPQAAGGAILGVSIGAGLSCVYFVWQYRRRRVCLTAEEAAQPVPSAWETAKKILKLAVPITIGATGLQIFNTLGSKIILGRLQDAIGLTSTAASSLYGVYSMAQTLYLLPSAFVQPLTVGIIPTVTAAWATGNREEGRRTEESAIRMAGLIAMPCGLALSVLASPIQKFLYGYDAATLEIAGPILMLLGVASILYCLILVTNAILQAHGKTVIPMIATLAGGLVSVTANYLLVGNAQIHIYGAAVATLSYCVVAVLVNILAIRKLVNPRPRFLAGLWKPALAAAFMAAVAFGVYQLLHNLILTVAVAVVVYAVLVVALKIVTWYDCQLLPKGELIAKFLRIRPEKDA